MNTEQEPASDVEWPQILPRLLVYFAQDADEQGRRDALFPARSPQRKGQSGAGTNTEKSQFYKSSRKSLSLAEAKLNKSILLDFSLFCHNLTQTATLTPFLINKNKFQQKSLHL
jgi:hypothetical protein